MADDAQNALKQKILKRIIDRAAAQGGSDQADLAMQIVTSPKTNIAPESLEESVSMHALEAPTTTVNWDALNKLLNGRTLVNEAVEKSRKLNAEIAARDAERAEGQKKDAEWRAAARKRLGLEP